MTTLRLICNKGCKQEFILVGVGAETVRDDIWKHGFACPHCSKEYISYYTNAGIRELQELQRQLIKKPKKNKRLLKDLKARIKTGMDRLKEEIENEKS